MQSIRQSTLAVERCVNSYEAIHQACGRRPECSNERVGVTLGKALIPADECFDSLSMNGNLQVTFMLWSFIVSYLRTPRNPPTSMVEAC